MKRKKITSETEMVFKELWLDGNSRSIEFHDGIQVSLDDCLTIAERPSQQPHRTRRITKAELKKLPEFLRSKQELAAYYMYKGFEHSDPPPTYKDIADKLSITPAEVKKTIDRIEKRVNRSKK